MPTDEPKYRQIIADVVRNVRIGELKGGDMISPLAVLAHHWGVSKNTIVKAMDILEARGVVERKSGSGTFIRQGKISVWDPEEVTSILAGLWDWETSTSEQVDMISIPVPDRKPDKIIIQEPSEIGIYGDDWPYLITYYWPEAAGGKGDQMDLALFQRPEDVVEYVLGILRCGGISYKVGE